MRRWRTVRLQVLPTRWGQDRNRNPNDQPEGAAYSTQARVSQTSADHHRSTATHTAPRNTETSRAAIRQHRPLDSRTSAPGRRTNRTTKPGSQRAEQRHPDEQHERRPVCPARARSPDVDVATQSNRMGIRTTQRASATTNCSIGDGPLRLLKSGLAREGVFVCGRPCMYVPSHTRCSVPRGALRASTVLHLVTTPCPQRGPLAAPTRARTLPTLGEKNGRRDPRGHFSLSLLFCYSG